ILSKRENLEFETEIRSDSAALHGLVAEMIAAVPGIAVLRDPTRGGLATALNEIARASGVGVVLQEEAIPVGPDVEGACELLGLDPLYVANEGKLICICEAADADRLLAVMRAHPLGGEAARIGAVVEDADRMVIMQTAFGGSRVVDWLSGEQLPRIC
ncbi:MAG: AIR synthase-related protein, partial [Roseibium sp.]